MVVPLANGDVDVSMLKEAVELINGRFDTEVGISAVIYFSSWYLMRLLLQTITITDV